MRKASEKSVDEERANPEEVEESKAEVEVEDVHLIEVAEKCSAIIIKRSVLTRKVLMEGGEPINHLIGGEDVVIEM